MSARRLYQAAVSQVKKFLHSRCVVVVQAPDKLYLFKPHLWYGRLL